MKVNLAEIYPEHAEIFTEHAAMIRKIKRCSDTERLSRAAGVARKKSTETRHAGIRLSYIALGLAARNRLKNILQPA